MVLHFDMPMQSGDAMVTSGTGSVSSVSFSGNDMLVNLTGVADAAETDRNRNKSHRGKRRDAALSQHNDRIPGRRHDQEWSG